MKHFLLLLLIIITSLSCISSVPELQIQAGYPTIKGYREISVYTDIYFDINDQKNIEEALFHWNNVLNGGIIFNIKSSQFNMGVEEIKDVLQTHGLLILKIDSNAKFIPDKVQGEQTLAWADELGGVKIFIVRDRLRPQDIQPIMLHELGHILGAKHVDDEKSLMYSHFNQTDHPNYQCVDRLTAQQVAKINYLNMETLNYCIQMSN